MAKIIYFDDDDNICVILDIPENFQITNTPSFDYDSISVDTGVNFWDLMD